MKQYIEAFLRKLTGFEGEFSREVELFWQETEAVYRACGVMSIPTEHLPIWYARLSDKGLPLDAPSLTVATSADQPEILEPPRRGPGRPPKALVGV